MKYEEIIKSLDEIANKLDSDKTELSEAVSLFEKSVELARKGFEIISTTSGKITVIKKELEEFVEKPFEN